ncbi:hypothetical protein ABES38_07305 [Bacillus gobiensis]|uniref:hypothetical protein n=1 Tax=Bacillus gobiensis TaxID=1441095 RepID=UPI003D25D119
MNYKLSIVDLTPSVKELSSKIFRVTFHINSEVIIGYYIKVHIDEDFKWVLVLNRWKYIKLKSYCRHLNILCDQLNTQLEQKYGFKRQRIIINHISNLTDPHNTGDLSLFAFKL